MRQFRMPPEQDAYHELCYYTLAHGDPSFIHQHVVDAFMAQTADEKTKPIGLTFSLVGLFLHVEKGLSGRDVQRVHMRLGKEKRQWPAVSLPRERGAIRVTDVAAAPAGPARDDAIHQWCVSVWNAYRQESSPIIDLLREFRVI